MSKYVIDENTLIGIGDAIRAKAGTTDKIIVSDLADAITNLPTGGGGDLPEELFNITGSCNYKFSNNNWNDFIELYGNKITSNNITNIANMFENSNLLTEVPFEINMAGAGESGVNCFNGCEKLETAPMINNWRVSACNNLFDGCQQLRNIPETFGDNWDYSYINTLTMDLSYLFNSCFSLRKIPVILLNNLWSNGSTSKSIYYRLVNSCYCLDELNGLGVSKATLTSNAFNASFSNCSRLKDMTFAVNEDGTPKTANWKSQTISLTYVGFNLSSYYLYNSGITADKEVKDDATYQALKNDPDWFTRSADYARYNHDSAINTINSLPDTSAYLAANGGTNTIKFSGAAGALTDGGAINTLTEEEIAVAAAKGWSVALV